MTKTFLMGAAAALLATCSPALRAAPLAMLTCTAENQQLAVDVSSFEFGSSVSQQQLNIQATASQFAPLRAAVNRKMSCALRATLQDGTVANFQFKDVTLSAGSAGNVQHPVMEATLQFRKLTILSGVASDETRSAGTWYAPTETVMVAGSR